LALAILEAGALQAQQGATMTGRVHATATGQPIALAEVTVEGTTLRAVTDDDGRYRITGIPAGTQFIIVRSVGFAPVRLTVSVPSTGIVTRDIALAATALELPEIVVTAPPVARARGELATASVIDRDAIANQTASSLRGVLELVPGVPIQPPGLGNAQQFALRTVSTTSPSGLTAGGPSPASIAAFGTAIILDGVPLTNNANLQTLGPRGELSSQLNTTAGGGVDLRQIPAATIERVEVIRGIPSARYGDLTEGAIVVESRTGVVPPAARFAYDATTIEANLVGGRELGRHVVSLHGDVTHTQISPGANDDDAWRVTAQLGHHLPLGSAAIDSRIRFFQVRQDNPEQPEVVAGRASRNSDRGIRVMERLTAGEVGGTRGVVTVAVDHIRRESSAQRRLVRAALPFTDRLTEGRQEGRYIEGSYLAAVRLDGAEWSVFTRAELEHPRRLVGMEHELRLGVELRREWNAGAGYQFDILHPPQVTFNGVQGFDRPRPFDAVPPVAVSAPYLDDRMRGRVLGLPVEIQAGLRVDMLHRGSNWASGVRDAVLQPRLNAQLAPFSWLRLRAGAGRTAKAPPLSQLFPAPQYFDVVNVNYFANDPAERLALLTTFVRDPANPDLGFSRASKVEAGIEISAAMGIPSLAVVVFQSRTTGSATTTPIPEFITRERFALDTIAPGQPPAVLEPPIGVDTIPILVDRPSNAAHVESRGIEATLLLPQIRLLRLTIAAQGAWTRTRFSRDGADFGIGFGEFQLNPTTPRAPYWTDARRDGERGLVTWRLIHHQPALGLVITATVEHTFKQETRDSVGTDTLTFAGYVTRTGELVPVPPEERGDPQYADIRRARSGTFSPLRITPADWIMSVQVSKSLPLAGELRFYAFNSLDRIGRSTPEGSRGYPSLQFGVEVTVPLAGVLPVGLGTP
jgi:outer membrane receptor protein involved in Fe transport